MESLNTYTSAEVLDKQDSNYEIKTTIIENTPFTIVEMNKEYFGVIGSHRITEMYESKEECEKNLKEITWDRLTQVIWAVVEKFKHNLEK
jgi:hypothetical protein